MKTLTTCNSCDSKPMAEGQESPDELGYCFDCLAEHDARYDKTGHTAIPSRYFAPVDSKGKYHAMEAVGFTTRCGANVLLDPNISVAVDVGEKVEKIHPIVCRRCIKLSGVVSGSIYRPDGLVR